MIIKLFSCINFDLYFYFFRMCYSIDFRKNLLRVRSEEGLSVRAVSERFGVCSRSVYRWMNRLEPKSTRNKPSTKINMDLLRQDIESCPDLYQYERAKKFGVSTSCIFYAIKRLGISSRPLVSHFLFVKEQLKKEI